MDSIFIMERPGGEKEKLNLTKEIRDKTKDIFLEMQVLRQALLYTKGKSGPEAVMPVPSRISAFQCLAGMAA